MGELEQFVAAVVRAIRKQVGTLHGFRPGKVSLWIKLVRPARAGGPEVEETVGHVQKLIFVADSEQELVEAVAENLVLNVFGSEVQLVDTMPNLILKLFDRKWVVPMPGAPPLDQAGQLFLKATVYEFRPSLWSQLFPPRENRSGQ